MKHCREPFVRPAQTSRRLPYRSALSRAGRPYRASPQAASLRPHLKTCVDSAFLLQRIFYKKTALNQGFGRTNRATSVDSTVINLSARRGLEDRVSSPNITVWFALRRHVLSIAPQPARQSGF